MEQAYPLHWPEGFPRTPIHRRELSRFEGSFSETLPFLKNEVARLNGKGLIISTNRRLKRDGDPYASDKEPEDSGVAIYFTRKGERVAMACDKYRLSWENMKALAKTIEAMRGIERWGSSDLLDRAFTGFAALPSPDHQEHWSIVLGVDRNSSTDAIKQAWRDKSRKLQGNDDALARINVAYDSAKSAHPQ